MWENNSQVSQFNPANRTFHEEFSYEDENEIFHHHAEVHYNVLVGSNPKLITKDSSSNNNNNSNVKKQQSIQSRPDSSLKKYFNEFKRESLSQSFVEEDEDEHHQRQQLNHSLSQQKTSTTIESAQQHQQQQQQLQIEEVEDVNKSFNYFEENNIEQYYEGYVHSEHSTTADELNNTILNVNNILEGYHHNHQTDSLCEDDEQTRKFNEEDLTEATCHHNLHHEQHETKLRQQLHQKQQHLVIEEASIADEQTLSENTRKLENHYLDNTETYDKESFNFHTELYITETDDDKTYQLDNTEFDDLNNKEEDDGLLDETTVFENNIEDTNQELVLNSTTFIQENEDTQLQQEQQQIQEDHNEETTQFYGEETCQENQIIEQHQQDEHIYEEANQFNEAEETMQHQEFHQVEQIEQQQQMEEDLSQHHQCEESVATVTQYDNNLTTSYQEEENEKTQYNYMDTYNQYEECNQSSNQTSNQQTNQYYQTCGGENNECHEEENIRKYKEFFEKQSYFIEDCNCNHSHHYAEHHHHHQQIQQNQQQKQQVEQVKKCEETIVKKQEKIDQKSYFADCNRGYKLVEETKKQCDEAVRREEKKQIKREEKKACVEQQQQKQLIQQQQKCTENKVKQQIEEKKECKEAMFKQSDFIFDKSVARSQSNQRIRESEQNNKKICLESMALSTHSNSSNIRKSTGDLSSINYATFERELKSHQQHQQQQQQHKRFSEVKLNFSSNNLSNNNNFAAFDAKQASFATYSSNGSLHQASAKQEAKFAANSNNMFIGGHASRSYNSLINTNQFQQNHQFQQQQQQHKTASRQQNFFIDSACCDALIQNIAALHNAKKQQQQQHQQHHIRESSTGGSSRRISNLNTQISAKKSCAEIKAQVGKGECVEVVHCVDKSNPNGYFFDMGKESDQSSDDGVKRSYKIIFKKY